MSDAVIGRRRAGVTRHTHGRAYEDLTASDLPESLDGLLGPIETAVPAGVEVVHTLRQVLNYKGC